MTSGIQIILIKMTTKTKTEMYEWQRGRNICYCGGILVNHKGNEYEPDEIACIECDKSYPTYGNNWKEVD